MKHIIEIGSLFKTNSYGDIRILENLKKGYFLVEFVETGYKVTANRANIVAGKVRDGSRKIPSRTAWEDCEIHMKNNAGDDFTIVQKRGKDCVVHFPETNYMTYAHTHNVLCGKISDPYKKTFLGIGYIGEYTKVHYWKKAKQLWSNMMKRCYSEKDQKGYLGKAFVDSRWHCFANFLEDLPTLDNFDGWLDFDNTGVKYNLDKDLKIPGNTVYSRVACTFELESLNKGATIKNNYYR